MTAAEKKVYFEKNLREALAHDIKDARKIYKEDGLYNEKTRNGLKEIIKQNKLKNPKLYEK